MNGFNILLASLVAILDRGRGSDRGATAVEYGIMAGFIAAVVVLAVTLFGTTVSGLFASFNTAMGW